MRFVDPQVTNEIVRQLLDQGGMYSLEKPIGDMKFVVDTRYLAAMNVPGGGKNDIPHRLKRQFACFNVPLPSVAAINGIFGKLVEGRFALDVFTEEVVKVAGRLVPLTITLWNKIQGKMLPTPAKFHYMVGELLFGVLDDGSGLRFPCMGFDLPDDGHALDFTR